MPKLGSRTNKLDVSFEILLLTFELPIPAPKRESRWSVSEREVGNREVVKFPGHDLWVLLVDWEWGGKVIFLTRDGGHFSLACSFGEFKPLKYAFGGN